MAISVKFRVKSDVDVDKHRLLELFFRDWVDTTCENEVKYDVEKLPGIYSASNIHPHGFQKNTAEIFNVNFDKQEDALAILLKGVPPEFSEYLEIIE